MRKALAGGWQGATKEHSQQRSVTEEQRRQAVRQSLAQRVADLCRRSGVARRSKIPEGYSSSSRLAAASNLKQRTRFLFMRWVLVPTHYSCEDRDRGYQRSARLRVRRANSLGR